MTACDTEKRIEPAGCTATGLLKVIALASMCCDHFGKMMFGNMTELRALGRIAFPLYCWCLVVGVSYTRSVPKYLGRLLLLFVISQPFYMVALNHGWNDPNIFLTMVIGVLALWGLREKRYGSQIWAPVAAIVLAQLTHANYGWKGILLMCLLWGVRDSRAGIACVMTAFCLWWGSNSAQLKQFFFIPLDWADSLGTQSQAVTSWLKLQTLAIAALPFMLMRPQGSLKSWKMSPLLGYSLYPLHLLVLIVCEGLFLSGGWASVYARFDGMVLRPLLALFGG